MKLNSFIKHSLEVYNSGRYLTPYSSQNNHRHKVLNPEKLTKFKSIILTILQPFISSFSDVHFASRYLRGR